MSKEIKAKEFLHNLSLYDGNNDHFHNSHAVYRTSQLMEMYAKSKIEALTKEVEELRREKQERFDNCTCDGFVMCNYCTKGEIT
jgi:hypothetical protein